MLRGLLASGALELKGVWSQRDSMVTTATPTTRMRVTLSVDGLISMEEDDDSTLYEVYYIHAEQHDVDEDGDGVGEWVVYEQEATNTLLYWPDGTSLIMALQRAGHIGPRERVMLGEDCPVDHVNHEVWNAETREPLLGVQRLYLRRRLTVKDAAVLMTQKNPSLHMGAPLFSRGRTKALDSLKLKLTKQDRADLMVWLDAALERGILS